MLRAWLRFPGQSAYPEGAATTPVNSDGTFEWGRKAGKGVSTCAQPQDGSVRSNLVGLTTSNAMTYRPYAAWDEFTWELIFTTACPHLDAEGQRLTGDDSMSLTEQAAQRLWRGSDGITDRVRVEVSDIDGVEVAATVSVTRRDGQIRVEARGFGFSLKQASRTQFARGASATPKRLKAAVRGAGLTVTRPVKPKVTHRMRVTTGEGVASRVVRQLTSETGKAAIPYLTKGTYRIELVAANARGKSAPAITTAVVP